MIVVILVGGLGNQMFEYSAGRAMALRNGTELVLNTHNGFQRDRVYRRVFCLDVFNIKYIHRKLLSFDFPYGFILDKISRQIGRHILFPWYRYLKEEKTTLKDVMAPIHHKHVILSGLWLSQDYFSDYTEEIRKEFTPTKPLSPEVESYVEKIRNSKIPVVAMGVRVYQEIKNQALRNSNYFYTNGDFYNNALSFYKEKLGVFKLFIFTQAEDWVKQNVDLGGLDYEFIQTSHSDADAINDMYIMSRCHHYIMSNSTFYFWGAWLNKNRGNVIVPNNWEKTPLREWIRMS